MDARRWSIWYTLGEAAKLLGVAWLCWSVNALVSLVLIFSLPDAGGGALPPTVNLPPAALLHQMDRLSLFSISPAAYLLGLAFLVLGRSRGRALGVVFGLHVLWWIGEGVLRVASQASFAR